MARIPGIEFPRWYERQWIGEVLSVVSPAIAASITAYLYYSDKTKPRWLLGAVSVSIASLILAAVLKTKRAFALDKKQAQAQSPSDLAGAVHVLYALLQKECAIIKPGDKKVRITIHKVVEETDVSKGSEWLEQVIPYVGGEGGLPGRRFPIRSGIIGLAVRDQTAYASSRQNDDYMAFVRELVKDWGYTQQDAEKLSKDRYAWMAVPVFGTQNSKRVVIGVIYLDSDDQNIFTQEVKELVFAACGGIAAYIDERYK